DRPSCSSGRDFEFRTDQIGPVLHALKSQSVVVWLASKATTVTGSDEFGSCDLRSSNSDQGRMRGPS
ncbi:MAG: hypothetical protein ACKOAH_10555, partial [Pirellula sp.]